MMQLKRPDVIGLCTLCLAITWGGSAAAASFTDINEQSPLYMPTEYLKVMGIMKGYDDGTFRPDTKVNRAEAVKLIVAPLISAEQITAISKSAYGDVPADAWYMPYVEFAREKLGIIDGPPKATSFHPTDPVRKAQLFKMFFIANNVDVQGMYSELKTPFSADAADVGAWYYPYMRYALASSMTMVTQEGTLGPDRELTRGDIAMLLYRYYMYRDGRRTQALLSEAESEIVNVLQQLEKQNLDQAYFAASRALIASRGALTSKPDEPLVKGAVKTAEGFQTLVQAYFAGSQKQFAQAAQLASDAWHLAEKAKEFSPSLASVADQMQTIAKNMADEARKLQTAPQ
jgi:hypothetical protein